MSSYRYSKIISCALYGINGVKVEIEVSILPGLSSFEIVGLADSAIKESRDRVHAAIMNNDFEFPNGHITVGMAPGFIRKAGTAFDLPIAIGILIASRQIQHPGDNLCIMGEMSLSGDVKGIPGTINRIITANSEGIDTMILPYENINEGEGLESVHLYGVRSLKETVDLLQTKKPWPYREVLPPDKKKEAEKPGFRDITTIIGQTMGVRALQIAAAGMHNLFLIGSPGCGKSSLAGVLPGIMPELDRDERIEVTKIYSSCGMLKTGSMAMNERPFRAPHHNATLSSITGGGLYPVPGEITLAHRGILFLDEMNEFPASILDMLRQPMEEQRIRISRNKYSMEYPADFILIGAANPCRCGNKLERDSKFPCVCSAQSIEKYFSNISGPIMDRMDLYVEMTKVPFRELKESITEPVKPESHLVRERVRKAWEVQRTRCRYHHIPPQLNSRVPSAQMMAAFELEEKVLKFAIAASEKLELSVRGYQKILRVARTIADYDGDDRVTTGHIAQALQFRRKT